MRSLCAAVALTVLVAGPASGQDEDPFAGTWKLNVEKSTVAKAVRSATMRLRVAIDETDIPLSTEKMDMDRVYADGRRETISYTARFSGADYEIVNTVTGAPIHEEARLKNVDATTRDFSRLRDRKVLSVSRRVLSQDGKTLTVTTTRPDGSVQDAEVWERQ